MFDVESIKWEKNKIIGFNVSILKQDGGSIEKKYFTLKELHYMQVQNEIKVKMKELDPLYNNLICLPVKQKESGGRSLQYVYIVKIGEQYEVRGLEDTEIPKALLELPKA